MKKTSLVFVLFLLSACATTSVMEEQVGLVKEYRTQAYVCSAHIQPNVVHFFRIVSHYRGYMTSAIAKDCLEKLEKETWVKHTNVAFVLKHTPLEARTSGLTCSYLVPYQHPNMFMVTFTPHGAIDDKKIEECFSIISPQDKPVDQKNNS